jgi:hypothetical protein
VTETLLNPGDKIAVGVLHLLTVRPMPVSARPAAAPGPAAASHQAADAARASAAAAPARIRLRLPVWLIAYLAVMGVAVVYFGVQRATQTEPGLQQVLAEEAQYASARGLAAADTARLTRLLETAAVFERRGDLRSAYEAYRDALAVRQPVDPASPAYQYAARKAATARLQ